MWERTQAYVKRVRMERKHELDVRERRCRSDSLLARVCCSSGGEVCDLESRLAGALEQQTATSEIEAARRKLKEDVP